MNGTAKRGSISFFGLVAMGVGCMLGTSWLLLTGTWLETARGPLNLNRPKLCGQHKKASM